MNKFLLFCIVIMFLNNSTIAQSFSISQLDSLNKISLIEFNKFCYNKGFKLVASRDSGFFKTVKFSKHKQGFEYIIYKEPSDNGDLLLGVNTDDLETFYNWKQQLSKVGYSKLQSRTEKIGIQQKTVGITDYQLGSKHIVLIDNINKAMDAPDYMIIIKFTSE